MENVIDWLTFFSDISLFLLTIKDRNESTAGSEEEVTTSHTQRIREERDEIGQRASKYEGDEI